MGLQLLERSKRTFSLILPGDDAILKTEIAEYQKYYHELDESHLTIEGNPWRILVKPAERHLVAKAQSLSETSGKEFAELMDNAWFCSELTRVCVYGIDFGDDEIPPAFGKVMARESGEAVLSREVLNTLGEASHLAIAALSLKLKVMVEEVPGK